MNGARPALTALVLAGGAGRRLGGRKDDLLFGEATLLSRALALAASLSDDVLLAPGPWTPVGGLPAGVRVVADDLRAQGPLGGLLAGLLAARHDACLLLPCDMPFARADVAARLAERATGAALAVAVVSPAGREPFHGIWRRGCLPLLEVLAMRGGRSLQSALEAVAARGALVEVPAGEMADLDPQLSFLVNVNTAEDLDAARARSRP